MLKQLAVGVIVVVALAGAVAAGPYEDGVAAYEHKDYAVAFQHWRPLAEEGHAEAQIGLGLMFAMGSGMPQDPVMAYMWLDLAAGSGAVHAGAIYADAVSYRDMVAAEMTPEQLAEARRLAEEWLAAR